jgi:transposase
MAMCGGDAMQESLFTVAKLDDFVPTDHPLRAVRALVNDALTAMNAQFSVIYADSGRDSIAPEKLIRALLLQVFYSIRSERQLCEQLRYNLLFRWFVGLALDDPIWDHSTFSKNRDRLLAHRVVEGLFAEVMRAVNARGLLSKEHFSVDGTLIQAWASQKSFRPKDGSDDRPREAVGAMRKPIGKANRGPTIPTRVRLTPMREATARAITRRRCSVTKLMC